MNAKQLCVIAMAIASSTLASEQVREKVPTKLIYFSLNPSKDSIQFGAECSKNTLRSLKDSTMIVAENAGTHVLWFNWLNPLRYKITWSDSSYPAPDIKEASDYIQKLVEKFSIPSGSSGGRTPASLHGGEIEMFHDSRLSLLDFLTNQDAENPVFEFHRKNRNALLKIDKILEAKNQDSIHSWTKSAYRIDNKQSVDTFVESMSAKIAAFKKQDADGQLKVTDIKLQLEELDIGSSELAAYYKKTIDDYLTSFESKSKKDSVAIARFTVNLAQLRNSLSWVYNDNEKMADYYRFEEVDIRQLKDVQSKLTVEEFRYNPATGVSEKASSKIERTIFFSADRFTHFKVGAGFFYSSVAIGKYGVTNGDSGKFTVTKDELQKNTLNPALFLNVQMGNSQVFGPLLQFGVSPVSYPFLLLGGGVYSPALSDFSLAIGGVWLWEENLTKLEVGQSVESSSALEKDLRKEFDYKPDGGYISIQYTFDVSSGKKSK